MTKKDSPPPATLGTQLLALRSVRDWSQRRAAEACGVYQQTYQRWEVDEGDLHLSSLLAIAKGFGVAVVVTTEGAAIAPARKGTG